ncbi:glycosyltransferase family 4 protein [Parvibaculum sp.]|uniref:glycosyltransferase family 4 protein n=1 Tax=Parvibaculum sp. TaxID=2024848 RepID=UPI001B2C7518|nr:glycosyltransferase family 4 protein [Parvibaculum sp.]MBO6668047.1 glycosyltransferase family 4 protein [Parvibaculum sp.]MBO6690149.1 glycosyltransferase family 4 protein [Henriciella sp.]MBO6715637.1 glycosyltransferase family 4 protein [Parvibaculum sp.]
MKSTIWYISKYVTPSYAAKVGARGFLILREFARQDHRAVLITSDSNHLAMPPKLQTRQLHEVLDGVDVHWLRTRKYRHARSIGRVISWLDFEWQLWRMPKASLPRPDTIIISSLSLLTILNGLWMRRRYRCKLVFEVRDIWPMVLTEAGKISRNNPFVVLLGWIERLAYRRADLIVGTVPNLGEHVADVTGQRRPVVCIPQGLDPALLERPEPVSEEYINLHIPCGKFVVCYAGSIGADNALETLVACAREMRDRIDIHFLIVGEGYLKKHFQEMAADLPNMTFAPGVPKAAVQSVLVHADLLYFAVHKSPMLRFGQSLNKIIDYMLAGKPVIASFTGFPSMINEAECGSFVPAGDVAALSAEIERYAAMPAEERARIGERGRNWLLNNRRFELLAARYLRCLGADAGESHSAEDTRGGRGV